VKPPTLLNMKEWRLGWEHKLFLVVLITSQLIGVLSYQKRFDCRFFIFHPECRGQYGKRSTLPALAQHQPNESPKFINDPNLDFGPKIEDLQMKNLLTYCSRYVFAPICRGVTSKRATVSPLVGNNHAIYDLILRQIKKQQEETKSDTIDEPSNLTPSEQANEDAKEIEDDFQRLSQEGPNKRSSWDLNDLGPGFTSFYRKRLYKRQAPHILDDLDTFTSFIKKKRASNVPDDLGLFTTFYKKSDKNVNSLEQQRNKAIDDLSSFTTFYKRDGGNQFSNARYRREALEDLGAFTTFMKKNKPFNEAAPSIGKRSSRHSREALLDSLGTFSSFMSPHQYYKRTPISSHVGSSPIG